MYAEGVTVIEEGVFRESFDSFYQRELTPVVGLAYVLSGSRAAAEDLAQEGFFAAYRRGTALLHMTSRVPGSAGL